VAERKFSPTLSKIVFTDYLCLLLIVTPIILVGLLGGLVYSGRFDVISAISRLSSFSEDALDMNNMFFLCGVLLVLIAPFFLMLRIGKIRRIFRDGVECEGVVVFIRQFRDRGRIEFEFLHEDSIIRAAHPVHLTKSVKERYEGEEVTVFYLPEKPKSACIMEIFK
jgi:hypothetical protein